MTPEFPLISIYKTRGLNIFADTSHLKKITTYTFISQNPDENKLYDKNGNCWTFSFVNCEIKNDFKTRFLAKTFYNPSINVDIVWKQVGKYAIADLKNDLFVCIDNDDDAITQFEDGNVIKTQIKLSDSFESIIQVLNKYVFDVDEKKTLGRTEETD